MERRGEGGMESVVERECLRRKRNECIRNVTDLLLQTQSTINVGG